jgi:hypothetical protein
MIYTLHELDGRHSHRDRFRYYLGFSGQMSNRSGPLHYNDAMSWFIRTYGWSAEVHQMRKIQSWTTTMIALNSVATGLLTQESDHCNPHWSWTNIIGGDLRIYVRGDEELLWFQLVHPVDQKIQK